MWSCCASFRALLTGSQRKTITAKDTKGTRRLFCNALGIPLPGRNQFTRSILNQAHSASAHIATSGRRLNKPCRPASSPKLKAP